MDTAEAARLMDQLIEFLVGEYRRFEGIKDRGETPIINSHYDGRMAQITDTLTWIGDTFPEHRQQAYRAAEKAIGQ